MTFQTRSLFQAAAAVHARDGVDLARLSDAELVGLSGEVAKLCRDSEVAMALVAGEIGRRSDGPDVGAGLARRQGFRSAGELVAQASGGSMAEARRLMSVGELLAMTEPAGLGATVDGEYGTAPGGEADPDGIGEGGSDPAPEPSPLTRFRGELADAVREGRIGIEAAALFTTALVALPDDERTRRLFVKALERAPGLPVHKVRELVWQAQAFADPEAWERREARQHEARTVTIRDDTDGMVTLTARLTPLGAAPIRAVLDAGIRWAFHARTDDPGSDPRTVVQIRADLLTDLCRHALDCTRATSGVKTTVVIRMTVDDLESGHGVGEIDGMPQPVTVRALRQAAADARIIPAVLGGDSEILDWGRQRRLFTDAQRLALVERDDGCAWCNAPPSWCDAHHIRWWERDHGPTDLDNAVLLCGSCHHRIHDHGWTIDIQDSRVSFIPPPDIDPARTPRPGGRHRYRIAA